MTQRNDQDVGINLPVNDILEIPRNTVMTQKNDRDSKKIDNCFLSKLNSMYDI